MATQVQLVSVPLSSTGVPRLDAGTPSVVETTVYDLDSYASLSAAVTALGSTNTVTLRITKVSTVAANVTVTSNITLLFLGAGQLSINSGVTVTLNGPVVGQGACFAGAGSIAWGAGYQGVIRANWFVTGGSGTSGSPFTGWDVSGLTHSGKPVEFDDGYYQTTGISLSTSTYRLDWRGTGIYDSTTAQGTVIIGTGAGGYVLSVAGIRYSRLRDMTIDGNGVKANTVILDGPSVDGPLWTSVQMTGATTDTLSIAPTTNTEVDRGTFINCHLQSSAPSSSQLRIQSTNALALQFIGGTIAGAGPYNVRVSGGEVVLQGIVFSSATTADVYLETESALVRVIGGETETTSSFLYAPAAVPNASYGSNGSFIMGLQANGVTTTAVTYAQHRPLTMIEQMWAGNVSIGSGSPVFVLGVRFSAGGYTGSGYPTGLQGLSDTLASVLAASKLNLGTIVTAGQNPGDAYLKQGAGIRWTNYNNSTFGGLSTFLHLNTVANSGTASLAVPGSGVANPNALIFVNDDNANWAAFALDGGNNSVQKLLDANTKYSTTSGNSGTTNVYYSAGNARYELQNNTGVGSAYRIWYLSASQ